MPTKVLKIRVHLDQQGPGGFYAVYFNLFSGIADREAENGTTKSASSIPSFGSKESVPNEVNSNDDSLFPLHCNC